MVISKFLIQIKAVKPKSQISDLYFNTVKIHQVLVQYKIYLHNNI